MFTANEIYSMVRQQPFRPFRIVTRLGEVTDVLYPDLVLVGRREVVVGAPSKRNRRYYEQITQIAITHITALQNLPAPPCA